MNLELLDPFQAVPEIIEDTLISGSATCCAFNKRGTLLAVGCTDGTFTIWDFDTRGVARSVKAHEGQISSISWSRNCYKLITTASDCKAIVWDVSSSKEDRRIEFESPVTAAQMHPKKNNDCVIFPAAESPVYVDLATGEKRRIVVLKDEEEQKSDPKFKGPVATYIGCFDPSGEKIFVGTPRGVITIHNSTTLENIGTMRICGSAIKSLSITRQGDRLLALCADRVIRIVDVKTGAQLKEFQDPVNRTQWKTCCFSTDGDFMIAGSVQKAQHDIYIWNTAFGQLQKILVGPKEGFSDLVWHPRRPIIASVSAHGMVYIWTTNYMYFQNWSAFAPDFTELEENVEYVEREDEFDIKEEEEQPQKKKSRGLNDTTEPVDIINVPKEHDDDSGDDLYFLPTVPEADPDRPPPMPRQVSSDEPEGVVLAEGVSSN